jgi:hypothetical protein
MYIIDIEYSAYEEGLTREHQEETFAADAAAIGLNTAGTLVTPAKTTKLLSGLAGAVTGVKGVYESDVVIAKTIQIIQAQMRANRFDVARNILIRMRENSSIYPLSLALVDLEEYYRAGTVTAGLIKAADTVGKEVATKKDEKDNAIVISKPANDDSRRVLDSLLYPNGRSQGIDPIARDETYRILGKNRAVLPVYDNELKYASVRTRLAECIKRLRANQTLCPANSLPGKVGGNDATSVHTGFD